MVTGPFRGVIFALAIAIATPLANASSQPLTGARNSEHIACAREAAAAFGVPLFVILTLLNVEGGWPGAEVANKPLRDGTVSYDLGPMQINDRAWGEKFARKGITREQLRDHACINIHAGTWILWGHWRDIVAEREAKGDDTRGALGEAMLRYHSRTPHVQAVYAEKVKSVVERGIRRATKAN
jgi:hypothetical protein